MAHVALRAALLKHVTIECLHSQRQKAKSHDAAHGIGGAPVKEVADQCGKDRTQNTNPRHNGRTVAAGFLRHHFTDQSNRSTEFARQANSPDEAQSTVGRSVMDKGISQVGQGIEEDRAV